MKISKYTYLFESKKFGYLVYNSMTNSFAELSKDLFDLLKDAKNNIKCIEVLDHETINKLKEAKIICDSIDELQHFYYKRLQYYSHSFSRETLHLTIAPTTSCNFACPYCFEEGVKAKSMSESTVNNLIKFIKKYEKIEGIGITWYGGEPLLAKSIVSKIYKNIKNIGKPIIENSIITNGYLLDEKNQQFLIDHEIKFIQVTLDGTEEIHNKRRHLKNGSPTYNKIISNIDSFLSKDTQIRFAIRINIDNNNYKEFFVLKNHLINRWHNNPNVAIYPGFLLDHGNEKNNACSFMSSEDISNFNYYLGVEEKMPVYFKFDSLSCGATHINSFVVGPDGELYKCWNDVGRNDMIVGNVSNDLIPNPHVLAQYLAGPTSMDESECVDCPLFFVCNGGCPWQRIRNKISGENYPLCNYRKNNINKFLELHYENKKCCNH